ncbi:MAG: GIY-YIG nuclease family protein [Sinimarinibacterium sp.]|jgi:hypothetical protein
MNRLLAIGFELAGHWTLRDDRLSLDLIRHSTQRNVLYAFVSDGQIKYVGKSIQSLSARMSGYRNPARTQTTNIKNNKRIRDLLAEGAAVDILALPDNGLLHYGPFHVNLAAALEDDIIRVLDPEWNGGQRTHSAIEPAGPLAEQVESERSPEEQVSGSFTFVLQPTYFQRGFFNVGVADQHLFGGDGDKIEVFLGRSSTPVIGTINRTANTNATPRIIVGSAMRDWFQSDRSIMDNVTVDVLTPAAVRIHERKN